MRRGWRKTKRIAWLVLALLVIGVAKTGAQPPMSLPEPVLTFSEEVPSLPALTESIEPISPIPPELPPGADPAVSDTEIIYPTVAEPVEPECATCAPRLRDRLFSNEVGCGLECYAGREPCGHCAWNDGKTAFSRFMSGLFCSLCCPDPCYEPKWEPIANAAFFVPGARPTIQTTIGWDAGLNFRLPDRAEYFWARADGMGKGPKPPAGLFVVPSLRYDDLRMTVEAGKGKLSVVTITPYRSVDPTGAPDAAGFSDIAVGPKTLLFDTELLQVSMQMLTYIPAGNAIKGLGVGHVSLEPSLIFGLRLAPQTYLQGQIAEWIPLGGDPFYSGALLHTHFSVNQLLYNFTPDVTLIGTMELNTWSFQDGAYTDPVLGSFQPANNETYASLAWGARLFVCDRIDIGFGYAYSFTNRHFAEHFFRTEFRWRF